MVYIATESSSLIDMTVHLETFIGSTFFTELKGARPSPAAVVTHLRET